MISENLNTHPEPTFEYFYIGATIMIAGLFSLSTTNLILSIVLLVTGLFILLSIKGVKIDVAKRLVKPYSNYFFIKFGNWVSLDKYSNVVLGINSNSKSIGIMIVMNVRTQSYYVALTDHTESRLELKEFTEYFAAKLYLDQISAKLKLPAIDKQEIITNIALANRPFRRK